MSITKYDDDFKKSILSLYQNGKTQTQLSKEYGVFHIRHRQMDEAILVSKA